MKERTEKQARSQIRYIRKYAEKRELKDLDEAAFMWVVLGLAKRFSDYMEDSGDGESTQQ